MQNNELVQLWKEQDRKLEEVLTINRTLVTELTKNKLNKTIGRLRMPKLGLILLALPYTFLLYCIFVIACLAGGLFVAIGFGSIALIMSIMIGLYGYHLYLIQKVTSTGNIVEVQEQLARLKLASFYTVRIAILQLPFWSICWVSTAALIADPLIYGGVNLLVFVALSYLTYWLYNQLSLKNNDSKVSRFFLAGTEWNALQESAELLEQLKEYEV